MPIRHPRCSTVWSIRRDLAPVKNMLKGLQTCKSNASAAVFAGDMIPFTTSIVPAIGGQLNPLAWWPAKIPGEDRYILATAACHRVVIVIKLTRTIVCAWISANSKIPKRRNGGSSPVQACPLKRCRCWDSPRQNSRFQIYLGIELRWGPKYP